MSHWALPYIGLAWHPTGDDVKSFNCWTFVRHIQKSRFGRDLPEIDINAENALTVSRACLEEAGQKHWIVTELEEEGDCVLMCRAQHPNHVGIWVKANGILGILHCQQNIGVVFQPPMIVKSSGWRKLISYRWHDEV